MTENSKIDSCPNCDQQVEVPDEIDAGTILRCPLCKEEFPYQKLVGQIPVLEIVSKSADSAVDNSVPPTIEIDESTVEQEPLVDSAVTSSNQDAFVTNATNNFDGIAVDENESQLPVQSDEPIGVNVRRKRYYSRSKLSNKPASRGSRRRKKNTNEFRFSDIIKIILGGLFALPIAQLIIWWAIKKDPINLGPAVSRSAPLIVPEQFHAPEVRQKYEFQDNNDQDQQQEKSTLIPKFDLGTNSNQ